MISYLWSESYSRIYIQSKIDAPLLPSFAIIFRGEAYLQSDTTVRWACAPALSNQQRSNFEKQKHTWKKNYLKSIILITQYRPTNIKKSKNQSKPFDLIHNANPM